MFRPLLLAAMTTVASTQLAWATGGVYCESRGGEASINIGMGRVPIMHALSASAHRGKQVWLSQPQDGETPFAFGQGMIESDRLSADFTDDNVERIIIKLRVDMSSEALEEYPGTLTFEDGVTFQVNCSFE